MRSPDVEAEVTLRSTEAGGRATPAASGYRPQHRVLPEYLTSGVHDYLGIPTLSPGGSAVATITFIRPEVYPHSLDAGDLIEISEGSHIVGHARVLRVLNPILQRESSAGVINGADKTQDAEALPESWIPVDARTSDSLVAELQRELSPRHVLFGHRVRAIARSEAQDDVLFESLANPPAVFVVHLTWKPETEADWPFTTRFDSRRQFVREWPREDLDTAG